MPQSLRSGTLYMMVGLSFTMGIGYFAQVIASRNLGPEIYGLYGLVIANVGLIVGLVDPGLSAAMATFVAEQDSNTSKSNVITVIRSGLVLETFTITVLFLISAFFFQSITNQFFSGNSTFTIFFICLIIFQGFYGLIAGVLQGLRELRSLAFVRVFEQICILLPILFLVSIFYLQLNYLLTIQIFASGIALIISILFVVYFIKANRGISQQSESSSKSYTSYFPNILKFAIPVSLIAFMNSIVLSSGPIVLNYLSQNNPGSQLGILVVILILARALNRVITTFFRSAFPYLVRWNTQGFYLKTKQYTKFMTLLLIGGYSGVLLFFLFFGTRIVEIIYGNAYISVAEYLPLAIGVFCIISIREVYRVTIYSIKEPGYYLVINFVGVGIYLLSIFLGYYFFEVSDLIILILLSIGLSNLVITIASIFLYRKKFDFREEANIHPVAVE